MQRPCAPCKRLQTGFLLAQSHARPVQGWSSTQRIAPTAATACCSHAVMRRAMLWEPAAAAAALYRHVLYITEAMRVFVLHSPYLCENLCFFLWHKPPHARCMHCTRRRHAGCKQPEPGMSSQVNFTRWWQCAVQAASLSLQWPLPRGATSVDGDPSGTPGLRVRYNCLPDGVSRRRLSGDGGRSHRAQGATGRGAGGTADQLSDGQHFSLLSFELIMLALLSISLPVVYWRKTRVYHL